MKILMINKFLYPNGGSETYIFELGKYLQSQGHEVQFFGMEHEGRCVGNNVGAYTSDMDFHGGKKLQKVIYPIKTIYSVEARKKIRLVLDDFKPDVCHLNNFNYQLTPSVILEIVKWRKKESKKCKIIYTAHDYQLVCPNHMMRNPDTHINCEKCLGGNYINCLKGRCIHGSSAKSLVGMSEAYFWKLRKVYRYFDRVICCSDFVKKKLDMSHILYGKTEVVNNFVNEAVWSEGEEGTKKEYVIYFGRFSEEKGINTLIEVCRELPEISFVFAGTGPLEKKLKGIDNIDNVGFQRGEALVNLIKGARFSVCPSEWYEAFGLSIAESQVCGTPVLGADIGGIPSSFEVGKTGELFESGNKEMLKKKIRDMWSDKERIQIYKQNCRTAKYNTVKMYYKKLMDIYQG